MGKTLEGRYRLEGALGRGATAEVYRATQLVLGRPVAVKVLRGKVATVSQTELIQRFLREATCLGKLTHPNTVRVHDAGTLDGRPFLVMEFVPGQPVASLCRKAPMEPLRAIRLARQVAGALDEAHRMGLVHRDLKPSNILVTAGPSGAEMAKVIDFGMVKQRANGVELTRAGQLLGTPMYMSPEVIKGKTAGPRADIYALGMTLYRMLTGTTPYSPEGGVITVLQRILRDPPVPLSKAAPQVKVPPFLEWTLAAALAKRTSERFADMRALEEALAVCEAALEQPQKSWPAVTTTDLESVQDTVVMRITRAVAELDEAVDTEEAPAPRLPTFDT